MISAKVIADSVSEEGNRLTTIEATYHRFVLAEVNTHRVISKNSASSRAIPVSKQIDKLIDNIAFPVKWAAEQKGMSGGDEISEIRMARSEWINARDEMIMRARNLVELGVHKSIVNRLLEPFMWHTSIFSSTSWLNFFNQRISPLAQPELDALAANIKVAIEGSEPKEVNRTEWHLPYVSDEERLQAPVSQLIQISVARCARVSYLTHDGNRDMDADLALYQRLIEANPPHYSPMEHVATPWTWNAHDLDIRRGFLNRPRIGNFVGWKQHRLDVEAGRKANTYS